MRGRTGVALERVEEHVEAAADVDGGRAARRVLWVDDAEQRAQGAAGDARLCLERLIVEDGRAFRRDRSAESRRSRSEDAPVVSDPVPAVVGTATRGRSVFATGMALPMGALTKSRRSASG